MVPDAILGLPTHPLIVHATVVLVPAAAVLVALAAMNGRFREWAGPVPGVMALVAAALAPLSTSTGESLEHSLTGGNHRLIEEHAELGDSLVWFVLPLAVVAIASYLLHRGERLNGIVMVAVTVVAVAVSAATMVDVVLIGHSGANAAWAAAASTGG